MLALIRAAALNITVSMLPIQAREICSRMERSLIGGRVVAQLAFVKRYRGVGEGRQGGAVGCEDGVSGVCSEREADPGSGERGREGASKAFV